MSMRTAAVTFRDAIAVDGTASRAISQFCFTEALQEQHYDRIAADYEAHYSDASSVVYRRRFIYEPMFEGIDLQNQLVLDAMCGSGQTTEYLLSKSACVTGLDISEEVTNSFRTRWPQARVVRRSLLNSQLEPDSFDCVAIVGGLHHIHPNVNEALLEIHRILKPGGYLCFMEPHSGSFPNLIRRLWYKLDHFFSPNEAAVDIAELEQSFAGRFEFKLTRYQGNIAFLLVLNSLIFRIPPGLKPHYSSLLMTLESVIGKFQRKWSSCFVVGQWQKK